MGPVPAPAPPAELGAHPAGPAAGGRSPRRRTWIWVVAAVAICTVALAVWRFSADGPAPLTRSDVDAAVRTGIAQAQEEQRNIPPDAVTAYRAVLPSLVTVTTTRAAGSPGTGPQGSVAVGAGVVINASGAVLTALHVVEGGGRVQVRFSDGTVASARIAKSEPTSDIAVLVVDRLPEVVVPAVMGGSAQVGDVVLPVGDPLGLPASLSAGVVSALDRSVRLDDGRTLSGLIQFDAAVNPGNSGGPLLDRNGRVVGIVTGLANPSHQPYFVGIGFAVPIGTAGGAAGGPRQ